jgi:hypothetical protein
MVSTLELPIIECKNLLSAVRDPETVDSLIEQEVQKGDMKGPFDAPPFSAYRVSPIGINVDPKVNILRSVYLGVFEVQILIYLHLWATYKHQHHLYLVRYYLT